MKYRIGLICNKKLVIHGECGRILGKNIKLEGLDGYLGLKGGLWLSNFKNWLKKTYGTKKVEFRRDLVNKSFSLEKIFVVGDTMLRKVRFRRMHTKVFEGGSDD